MRLSNPNDFDVTEENGDTIIALKRSNLISKIKQVLKDTEFNISIDYSNDIIAVERKNKGFIFEFVAKYKKQIKNYIASDYLSPNEADIISTIVNISDVAVYTSRSVLIDLTDKQQEEIEDIIYLKLVGTEITS